MSFYGDIQRWWVGTVEEDSGKSDPNQLGRCRVRIDGVHGPDCLLDDLPYAQSILPSTGGGTSGTGETPQLLSGAKVIGFFLDGALSQLPVIWGSIPHIGIPSVTQQQIAFKEKKSIIDTVNRKAFKLGPSPVINNTTRSSNLKVAWDFFSDNTIIKFRPHHISGMLGNFMHESGNDTTIDPTVVSGITNESSEGIAQWNPAEKSGNRLNKLIIFAKNNNKVHTDLLIQLEFVIHELRTVNYLNKGFLDTKTVEQATMHFMRWYLRPASLNKTTLRFTKKQGGKFPSKVDKVRLGEERRLENANKVNIKFTQGSK